MSNFQCDKCANGGCACRGVCKYCYGKGKYSKMLAGGTFGDSFDGHITIEPEIKEFDCRCQKASPEIPTTEKVAEQTGLIEWDKEFRTRFIKGHAPLSNTHHDLQEAESWVEADQEELEQFIQSLLLRQAEKTTKDIINKLDSWHWGGCAFILEDEGVCKCNLEEYLKSNKDE